MSPFLEFLIVESARNYICIALLIEINVSTLSHYGRRTTTLPATHNYTPTLPAAHYHTASSALPHCQRRTTTSRDAQIHSQRPVRVETSFVETFACVHECVPPVPRPWLQFGAARQATSQITSLIFIMYIFINLWPIYCCYISFLTIAFRDT